MKQFIETVGMGKILLYFLIILVNKSDPPVEEWDFKIIAVPIPVKIPPYIADNILSFVNELNVSKISINIDKLNVPIIDFRKNFFPILYPAIKNNGIFKLAIVTPIGIFNL